MRLYFMRHGLAEDLTDKITDAQRKLTDRGVTSTQQAARAIKALGIKPNRFYTSPLLRAQQTAEIVGKALGITPETRPELGPGFSIHTVAALTHDLKLNNEVFFVGHEPDFSTTIASLSGARILMKRGGLARVDVISQQPMLGELVWLIAPKIFELS
ncbi:MAG: phosphohistidine phosphatase SixA [Chloroflexi bacterium]|nr:phosphohistidine phosphatase SixA [Chloroflexota bacterium]